MWNVTDISLIMDMHILVTDISLIIDMYTYIYILYTT